MPLFAGLNLKPKNPKTQIHKQVELESGQPVATPDDCLEAEAIAKADPGVRRLLLERHGVTDMALVACDPWSVHLAPVEAGAAPGASRLIQCFMYLRSSANDNQLRLFFLLRTDERTPPRSPHSADP